MKNRFGFSLVLASVVFGFALAEETSKTVPAAHSPIIHVEKMSIGTAIDGKDISGEAVSFERSVNRLYCWTRVSSEEAPATINHVWYVDGKKDATVPLAIKYSVVRTWSSKSVWPGSWKVDVTDNQGNVLESRSFVVANETAPSAPPKQVGQ